MTTLLRIDVSPRGAASHSRRFADEVAAYVLSGSPQCRVVHRDLAQAPQAAIDGAYVQAMLAHTTPEASEGVAALDLSEQLIGELDAADALLISTPVHNYTVPAALKAWIDQIVRTGRTFKGTPQGKVGLLSDRPTIVVSASGGYFVSGGVLQPDFFVPYLDAILATVGIRDVHHIRLEGVTRGEDALRAAYAQAREKLQTLPKI